ncbi:hypothetical protein BDM02DRAFT_3113374 [Thelephora ganbajun]|uniref:Uncharacterized protein n=1 Tax=Thelephora ganbajun TaxID=370292 RepID=A0ACB6ZJG7_THEGA|nr:hypothetical protein BDM02DRAFT_3113374 [Thelephora ganbajun]
MASDPSAHPSRDEIIYESVESLRAQIKETEDKWNNELKRLETARKDKEELEQILQVLQTLVEYEREATLKMEAMLKETRDALGIPDEASRPTPETVYDPSRSTGTSSSGGSSVLEFDLVYNPNAAPKVSLKTSLVSSPRSMPDTDDQVIAVSPLLPTPVKPTSKLRHSPDWKSRITSILISTNNRNRTNPPSSSSRSLNSAAPLFDDAGSDDPKPNRAAKPQKRSSKDSENHGAAGWRRTMGSAGNRFANRANRDTNRKKPRDLASILQS